MYVIKNAFKNLIRNKNRNMLLGIIILSIIFTIAASMIINKTSEQAIRYYKAKFGAEVTMTNVSGNKENQVPLSAEKLLSFSDSKYIQSKIYTAQIAVIPKDLKVLSDSGHQAEGSMAAKAYVKGSNDPSVNEAFAKGLKKITAGAMYQNKNECIISNEFAMLNGLKPRDTITVISSTKDQPMSITLRITGIYEDKSINQENEVSSSLFQPLNDIYTGFNTVADSEIFQTYGTLDVKMALKDPNLLEKFKAELRTKGLPEYYSVSVDEDTYQNMVAPIEKIAGISNKVMLGVFGCGGLILLLLSLMTVRERKYEIGVLRAMGMKKSKAALGLLTESIAIVGLCLVMGLGIAKTAQTQLSKAVISAHITEKTAQKQIIREVQLGFNDFTMITLASLGLVLLSSISGVLFVTRYEPSKILSERN